MAALLIKNMPPHLHDSLRQRAAIHHRSMNREVIAILERELEHPAVQELPEPVRGLKEVDHQVIVNAIRRARDSR